ncbi:MAG: Gfo/Idh/MocA family oxidoreductase [Rhodothermales bacterium]
MSQIGVAVAGTGFIGPVHVEALQRLGNVRVTGILGSSPEKSEKARRQLGLSKGYADLDEVLDDPDVQAVHLAIPNVLHYEYTKRTLAAGKHVMCEKPLAMDAGESAELVELARASGLEAGVTYNIRFYPLNLHVREMIASGELGAIHSVVGHYVQDWLLYDTDYNWRVLAEKGGAPRALSDIGTHWIDLVTSITGLEVESVLADLKTVHPVRKRPVGEVETFSGKKGGPVEREEVEITTEDCASVLFRFKGGAKGQLWVSQVTAGRKNSVRYEISGGEKAVAWHSMEPNELWIGNRNEPNLELVRDPALMSDLPSGFADYPGGHNEGFPDTFKQCFRAFYDAIENGGSGEKLYPSFEEGHHEVALCDAMLESHRQERWVTL